MKVIPLSIFKGDDPVAIARYLLGKILWVQTSTNLVGGKIVETEAYSAREKGCHAYKGKTPRNSPMFLAGGRTYVYTCYGIHHLLNIVTNETDRADAVLIRALEPYHNVEFMRANRGSQVKGHQLTSGPGKLTKALGIDLSWNNIPLKKGHIWIAGDQTPDGIVSTKRVGIDYAGSDALLPWRFYIKGNPCISLP